MPTEVGEQVNYHKFCSPALDGSCEFYFTGAVPIPPLSARYWKKAYIADSPHEHDLCLDFMTPSYLAAFESAQLDDFVAAAASLWANIFPSDLLKGSPRQIFVRFQGNVEAIEQESERASRKDLEKHLRMLFKWNAQRGVVVCISRGWRAELDYAMGIYHSLHPFRLKSTCRGHPTPLQLQAKFAADILQLTNDILNPLPSPPSTPPPPGPSYTTFTQLLQRPMPFRSGWHWMPYTNVSAL